MNIEYWDRMERKFEMSKFLTKYSSVSMEQDKLIKLLTKQNVSDIYLFVHDFISLVHTTFSITSFYLLINHDYFFRLFFFSESDSFSFVFSCKKGWTFLRLREFRTHFRFLLIITAKSLSHPLLLLPFWPFSVAERDLWNSRKSLFTLSLSLSSSLYIYIYVVCICHYKSQSTICVIIINAKDTDPHPNCTPTVQSLLFLSLKPWREKFSLH